MATTIDTKVTNFDINVLTRSQYEAAKTAGEINKTAFYIVPEGNHDFINPTIDLIYPVGTIYETSNSSFDPNVSWGGTWVKIEGKVLVGYDTDDTDFSTVGSTGGAKGAWQHNHSFSTLITGWSGWPVKSVSSYAFIWSHMVNQDAGTTSQYTASTNLNSSIINSGSSNNTLAADKANMPPYEVVVIWKRTA